MLTNARLLMKKQKKKQENPATDYARARLFSESERGGLRIIQTYMARRLKWPN